MDVKEFIIEFMKFYTDEFIYLDGESLKFNPETNCLIGYLPAQIPAYRRKPIKDKILTNTESMFCANQILYAVHLYYHYYYVSRDVESFAQRLLDSGLIVDMQFRYNAPIETSEPIPFYSTIAMSQGNNGYTRSEMLIKIGKIDNFVIKCKGYIVDKIMHET